MRQLRSHYINFGQNSIPMKMGDRVVGVICTGGGGVIRLTTDTNQDDMTVEKYSTCHVVSEYGQAPDNAIPVGVIEQYGSIYNVFIEEWRV